ncbi:MAG: proline racemase family protein [Rhodospirillales bacterium]
MRLTPDPIETIEMHTGGEPTRIVVAGYPRLAGRTLLEKRRDARERHDRLRCLLMREPRGHKEMYGAVLMEPDHPEADLAVLFLHNEGYSTMCGHAVLALGRYAVDQGLVEPREPETLVRIQCPCGLVPVTVTVGGRESGAARFTSVPAFALGLDLTVATEAWGELRLDLGYGGAFYAILPAERLGLDLRAAPLARLVEAAWAVTQATAAQCAIAHPGEPDLGFLYGTILTDGGEGREVPSRNLCVFAGTQVDRSPTGSGVTARMAVLAARGAVAPGERRLFESIVGSRFGATLARETQLDGRAAVEVTVTGKAHYSGRAVFDVEADDPFPEGFLLD